MSTVLTGFMVAGAFYALGLGPALLLRSWTALPWRFLPLLALLTTACLSYGVFWIAFFLPSIRLPLVGTTLCASLAAAAFALRRNGGPMLLQRGVWGPALGAVLLTACYLGPVLVPDGTSVNERLGKLPADNILPGLFAHRVVTGASTVRPVPPLWPNGDRASERPPLQAAIVVGVGSMVPGLGEHEYQILASLCQAQWLPALWLVGAVCGFPRHTLAFVLVACTCSSFLFVNTIYTWPKLLAAALMLGALAVALETAAPAAARARTIVVAVLCTLSLLAHPGPAFTLLVVPLLWPLLRPSIRLRASATAALTAAALAVLITGPWVGYLALVDPPTGRLLREHLGDGRPSGSVVMSIVRANLERPLEEHLRIRLGNLAEQAGAPPAVLWPRHVATAQREQFFHHGAALGVLLIGLVAACWRPRAATADATVRRLTVTALAALAAWSLSVFPAGGALIHHGSPVTTALLFFAGAYGLTRLPTAAAATLFAVHVAAFLYVWLLPVWLGPWAAG